MEVGVALVELRTLDEGLDADVELVEVELVEVGAVVEVEEAEVEVEVVVGWRYGSQTSGLLYCDGSTVNIPFSTPRKYDQE